MEIAILTSSRADFGFYQPLLNTLNKEKKLKVRLVVFGTHLSKKHGYTINDIKEQGYKIYREIDTKIDGDSPKSVVDNIGNVHLKFSEFWSKQKFNLIVCLGDRYEMYAAISAAVPFNIPIFHLSGGEITEGAIDNYYRNALTLMATYHATNTAKNAKRVKQIIGNNKNVHHTGSLAIDNILETKLYSNLEFKKQFQFDISQPFILFTFHPETINFTKNKNYAETLKNVLTTLNETILVTMPNADTMGNTIREALLDAAKENKSIHIVESLGSKGYYTALSKCLFVLGNSSSGIVEAASFNKFVLNLGIRQKGRERSDNVIDCKIDYKNILNAIKKIKAKPETNFKNSYGNGKAAFKIKRIINNI